MRKLLLLLGALLVSAVGYSQSCTTYTYVYNDYVNEIKQEINILCYYENVKAISINESMFDILKFEKVDGKVYTWLISHKTKELFVLSPNMDTKDIYFLDVKNDLVKVFMK